jgi:hypothetical protein
VTIRTSPYERWSLTSRGREDGMHTPGSTAHQDAHHAALNRALDLHHAAHHAATEHARWPHDRVLNGLGAPPITDGSPEWTARRGGHPRGDRTCDVGGPLRFVVRLAVVAVLVAVVLLVLRPSPPEWLAQLVHEIDGFLRVMRSTVL